MVKCADVQDSGYDEVSAIEVCSIESAKKLGIYSTNDYYTDGYSDLKTYISAADTDRTKNICYQSADGANAYMYCSAVHSNIAYVKRGSVCQTMSCPTGWTGVKKCQKPLEDAVVSKRSHCDERWYDWFTIPNYHLGNKYQADPKIAGSCYNPCPIDHVPQYKQDPVDDSTFGLSSKQALDRCVPRNQYFGGKYQKGSDFCPLAWVYRIGASPDVLQSIMTSNIADYGTSASSSGSSNVHFMTLKDPRDMQKLATSLYNNTSTVAENITAPTERNMQQACRSLQNEPRVAQAYSICSNIASMEGEMDFLTKREDAGDSPDVCESKLKLLKQACNATFCDPENDAAFMIKQEPLCFKTETVTEGKLETEKQEKIPKDFNGVKFVVRALQIFVFIILIGCAIGLVVVIYRYTKPVLKKLVRLLLRVPPEISKVEDTTAEQVQVLENQIYNYKKELQKWKLERERLS